MNYMFDDRKAHTGFGPHMVWRTKTKLSIKAKTLGFNRLQMVVDDNLTR